jgi:lipoic acid synthetase
MELGMELGTEIGTEIRTEITQRKPEWLRKRLTVEPGRMLVEEILKDLGLNTVCGEAKCPNYGECFGLKTATFLILGTHCTRNCTFCNIRHAAPQPVDPQEPERVAEAVGRLGLLYVVVTSVTRDDLPDGGAGHFAETIRAIRGRSPQTAIEVLVPDFQGSEEALRLVAEASPAVVSHNMETVGSLYSQVRPQADYARSLRVIGNVAKMNPGVKSKSGIMVGLGETKEQVAELLDDLRGVGCALLTVGQYLSPSREHYRVREYVEPALFDEYKEIALGKGFEFVASAPFVRSSYHAGEALGL